MGQMSTKCARLRQWWSFRGPTSGGEAGSRQPRTIYSTCLDAARVNLLIPGIIMLHLC